MHQFALLVAMTATTGLFGGRSAQTCTSGTCYNTAPAYRYYNAAPAQAPAAYTRYYVAPQAVAAPAAQPAAPVAQPRPAAAPVRTAYYYPGAAFYAPTSTCPGGNCPRR